MYGEWVPVSGSSAYHPKPRPHKPNKGYRPPPTNYVPLQKPKPVYGKPKPNFTKPRPVYVRPSPIQPKPSNYKPQDSYKPVSFPTVSSIGKNSETFFNAYINVYKALDKQHCYINCSIRFFNILVDQHYGSPNSQEQDGYGSPVTYPVGPKPTPPPPPPPSQYVPSVTDGGNPFTPAPPYQTTFTAGVR